MTVDYAIGSGRLAAESLMADQCLVTRGGVPVFNETTGQYDAAPGPVIYSGVCKVQTRDVIVTEADAGDTEVAVTRWAVHLPITGSEAVRRGDLITITEATYDAALLGRVFTVSGGHLGTAKTARRVPVTAND